MPVPSFSIGKATGATPCFSDCHKTLPAISAMLMLVLPTKPLVRKVALFFAGFGNIEASKAVLALLLIAGTLRAPAEAMKLDAVVKLVPAAKALAVLGEVTQTVCTCH